MKSLSVLAFVVLVSQALRASDPSIPGLWRQEREIARKTTVK